LLVRRIRHCHMRPRCRWAVGGRQEIDRGPYKLLVSLVENHRVDGKVRQEHVADLGSVDGHLMPAFFDGVDPALVAEITRDGAGPNLPIARGELVFVCQSWQRASLAQQISFWQNLHATLSRLGDRIDAEAANNIMAAIHARIPMPTVEEISDVPLQRAHEGLADAESDHAGSVEIAEEHDKLAATARSVADKWRQHAEMDAKRVEAWREEINRLTLLEVDRTSVLLSSGWRRCSARSVSHCQAERERRRRRRRDSKPHSGSQRGPPFANGSYWGEADMQDARTDENDPPATFGVHCDNGFDADFMLYQSTRLRR
jgi:hypothetical protein